MLKLAVSLKRKSSIQKAKLLVNTRLEAGDGNRTHVSSLEG